MSAFWIPALPEHARPGVHSITPQKTCVYLTPSFSCTSALFVHHGAPPTPLFSIASALSPIQWGGGGCLFAIFQSRFSSLQTVALSRDLLQLSAASCRLSTSSFLNESPVTNHQPLSPLKCAVPRFRAVTPLECAVTKWGSCKSFRMRSSEKRPGGYPPRFRCPLPKTNFLLFLARN